MRILHVIASLDPEFGGPAEAVRALVELAPEGCESEVVAIDDPEAGFLRGYGFPVHALGPRRSPYAYSKKLMPWLRANGGRFDGVVVHGMWQYCGVAVWRAMGGRVPYIVFPHGMLDPYFKRAFPMKHWKKWVYWAAVEYWVLRGARRVAFTCEAERVLAEQSFWLYQWRAWVAPFGTVAPEGDAAGQRETFYAACPAVRGRRFLLFLGRIDAKKGCDLLVEAYARASLRDPRLDLVMAGPDAQGWREPLEQAVRAVGMVEQVHWPGMLRGDAKWGAFRAAEAFVLPSHQENFGIAVAEALACGRAVLLSDKVNIAAEIAADGAGLVEPDTVEGTQRLLERWIAMPVEEREAMGLRALDCFQRRYDMRVGAKVIVKALLEA